MLRFLLALFIGLVASQLSANSLPTYDEIHLQIEQEANSKIQEVTRIFAQSYLPALTKIGLTAAFSGIFLALSIHSMRRDSTLSCVYSALTCLSGYLTWLQHAELMEDRRLCNEEIQIADRVYNQKLAHVHTRHYLCDIAKFQMARLEEIIKNYKIAIQ